MTRRRSLRLISLSNYVFVLEISQISGIVPNVSMLIRVVMRVCGGRRSVGVGGGCHHRNRKHSVGSKPANGTSSLGRFSQKTNTNF